MSVRLFDFLSGLSGALDLMSPEVVGHHRRVAFIAARLSRHLDLAKAERTDLYMAALLHDVGGFTLQSRLAALQFEADGARHAEIGYRLLRTNPLLDSTALIVRHHHTSRLRFAALDVDPRKLFLANVLFLADRVDVLFIRYPTAPAEILERLRARAGSQFEPQAVEAMGELAQNPGFWATLATADPLGTLDHDPELFDGRGMSRGQLMAASTAFSQIIDFRSRFTATHSRGVAETAVQLARKARLPEVDLTAMRLAGNLHDLGKLAVPSDIIDKPGPLDEGERAIMHRHPELGAAILSSVPGLEKVNAWASLHHEQPNGQGYPHGLSGGEISLGSRIMSVADVFTALREDRPYRPGLNLAETLRTLEALVDEGALDPEVLVLLQRDSAEIDGLRQTAQDQAAAEFRQFYTGLPDNA